MNNPLNRRMFRQGGMSKQPMGILASSPELMTTAQKAMMNNQPIKAQSAVSVNTRPFSLGTPLDIFKNLVTSTAMANDTSALKDRRIKLENKKSPSLFGNFSYGSGPEKTYETKLVPEGSSAELKETTEKNKSSPSILGTPSNLLSADFNIKLRQSLKPKKNDSDLLKNTKDVLSGGYNFVNEKLSDLDNYLGELLLPKDVLERKRALDLQALQKEMNLNAEFDKNKQNIGTFGSSSEIKPTKDGSPRGLVDPDDVSKRPDAPPMPTPRPEEFSGVVALKKISDTSKQPQGISTKDADEALGISDLKFKDRVEARRKIISEALGRDVAEKDVRTDLNYNLMMTGLLVAAGESPNAMTNIAKGLAAGLAGYGKAKGEATEAKRKEDIAIGLAAVEQTFKETEAQKDRDKKPETIRALEFYKQNPDLLQIALQLKQKGKSRKEIATAIAARAAGGNNLIPPDPNFLSSLVDFAVSGGKNISSGNATTSIPNSIKINFDTDQKADDMVNKKFNRFGAQYIIGKDGIATLVTGGQFG